MTSRPSLSGFATLLCICAFASGIGAPVARADFNLYSWEPRHVPRGDLTLLPQLGYYRTQSNYDATGSLVAPSGLNSVERFQIDLNATYGISSRLSAFLRTSWTRVLLSHSTAAGEAFGFADQGLGVAFRLLESRNGGWLRGMAVDLQLQADFPFYSNTSAAAAGVPFLGNGSVDLTGGAFATLPITRAVQHAWVARVGAGFTWRTQGFSSAIPWSAQVEYARTQKGIYFGAAALGALSLKNDSNAASVGGSGSGNGAGGSDLVGAVNPSVFSLRGRVGYLFNPSVGVDVTVTRSLWGQSSPEGLLAQLGARIHIDGESAGPGRELSKPSSGFASYTFEGRVTRVNDRLNMVRIDKGTQDGVEMGQVFDIFSIKRDNSIGEVIARAECTSVKPDEAALTITEYFKEVWIEEGFIVKRPIQ